MWIHQIQLKLQNYTKKFCCFWIILCVTFHWNLHKQCGTRTSFFFSFLSLKLLHQSLHCFRFFFLIPAEVGLGSSKANFRIYLSSFLLNLRLGVPLVNTKKKIHSSHGLETQIYLAEGEAVLPSDSLWF